MAIITRARVCLVWSCWLSWDGQEKSSRRISRRSERRERLSCNARGLTLLAAAKKSIIEAPVGEGARVKRYWCVSAVPVVTKTGVQVFLASLRQKSSNAELQSRSNLMACDNRTKVYLGYEDEYVTEKHRSSLNFQTNKIGGYPVSKPRARAQSSLCFRAKISLPSPSLREIVGGNTRLDLRTERRSVKHLDLHHVTKRDIYKQIYI